MKVKLIRIIFPPIVALIVVFVFFKIDEFVFNQTHSLKQIQEGYDGPALGMFLYFTLPIIVILTLIGQTFFFVSLWKKYMITKKVFGKNPLLVLFIICLMFGFIFGYMLWRRKFGFSDFIFSYVISTSILIIYLFSNILTLKFLDKLN